MNILIVSHVAHIRNHLAVYLMLQDAIQDVHAVTSTQDVYAMLDAYSFDLLIVDLDLPGKTGFALVQHVHDTVMRINLLLLGFMLFNIAYITMVVNFLSTFENNRYRFPVDGFFLVLAVLALDRIIRKFFRRGAVN